MISRQKLAAGPRLGRPAEHRFPAVVAVLGGAVLYAALPSQVAPNTRILIPVLELLLLVPLVGLNPVRFTRETKLSRVLSLTLVGVIAAANLYSLVLLIRALWAGEADDGKQLLVAALQVWLTNIIVFGLAYWEIDRGGPVRRTQAPRDELPPADFRFSQDENDDAIEEVSRSSSGTADWCPTLIDYLYVSVTNSTAFSPTDTMPLSSRAKVLMSVQSVSALITSVLVIARAVSALQ